MDRTSLFEDNTFQVPSVYSVFEHLGDYYMIAQQNGFLLCGEGREIYKYRSDKPEGPFQNQETIYTIEDKVENTYLLTYDAQVHPQFAQNNELLISYNVNIHNKGSTEHPCPTSSCASTGQFDADGYRPKFVRLPMSTVSNQSVIFLKKMEVYPNPTQGILYFKAHKNRADFYQYTVFDINKKILKKGIANNQIDLTQFPNGIYFIRISEAENSVVLKIGKFGFK